MIIMICNIGSTSYKFKLYEMDSETELAKGSIEQIGSLNSVINFWSKNIEIIRSNYFPDHQSAVKESIDFLFDPSNDILNSVDELKAIGFKTVQGGSKNGYTILDEEVLEEMELYSSIAPAHNPPYISAIKMFMKLVPQTLLAGIFEPAFHTSIPDYAKIYGIPIDWMEKYGISKYGYHGASHRYNSLEAIKLLSLSSDKNKIISCHLGGSSSVCAIKDGKSFDTSMGFTPQTGLIQGNRVGDVDPYIIPFLMEKSGLSLEEIFDSLSNNSGLKGISGISSDMREIISHAKEGNEKAKLAREKFIYDVIRYIGEYIILMRGIDVIIFSGGIGQSDFDLRKKVIAHLDFLGVQIDDNYNKRNKEIISKDESSIKVIVMKTNEEIIVARETLKLYSEKYN